MRSGDVVQVALDLTGTPESGTLDGYTDLCLLPPVDDFGAQDALYDECYESDGYGPGTLRRVQLTYDFEQPNGYLVVRGRYSFDDPYGTYSFAVESVATTVYIGVVAPGSITRNFTYRASARCADNTPAADGLAAVLQWKRARASSPGPRKFRTLSSAVTSAGGISFDATLPARTARRLIKRKARVALRACVSQPGSDERRCTPVARVRVRNS